MALTTYTTYDEVRAALGVSKTELADTVLSLTQWETLVVLGLEEVNSGIPAMFTTVSSIPVSSRSIAEQRFYDLTRLYACYDLAQNLLASLPLFSVRALTDGRANFERQIDVYKDVKEGVMAMHDMLRGKLSASFIIVSPGNLLFGINKFVRTVAAGLGRDPVTNA